MLINNSIKNLLYYFKKRVPYVGKVRIAGTNSKGQIIVYHRGGGTKKIYRFIDFTKFLWNISGLIIALIYDANRTAALHLIIYTNGILAYNLAISNKKVGAIITTTSTDKCGVGNSTTILLMKTGFPICCIEITKYVGAQFLLSGNCFGKLLSKTENYGLLKLKNKRFFRCSLKGFGVYGVVYSIKQLIATKKLARFNIYNGRRPHVRGVAKNPIDHPHGGGQGKTSGGRPSVSRWAKITKGRKTRKLTTYDTFGMER